MLKIIVKMTQTLNKKKERFCGIAIFLGSIKMGYRTSITEP